MRVIHLPDLCEAHGLCALTDPTRFELDDDDNLLVLNAEVTEADLATVKRAIAVCPQQALRLEE